MADITFQRWCNVLGSRWKTIFNRLGCVIFGIFELLHTKILRISCNPSQSFLTSSIFYFTLLDTISSNTRGTQEKMDRDLASYKIARFSEYFNHNRLKRSVHLATFHEASWQSSFSTMALWNIFGIQFPSVLPACSSETNGWKCQNIAWW